MYICERCGYSTTIKCNLKNHLSRKKICPNTYSNKDVIFMKSALIHKLSPNEPNPYTCKFCFTPLNK